MGVLVAGSCRRHDQRLTMLPCRGEFSFYIIVFLLFPFVFSPTHLFTLSYSPCLTFSLFPLFSVSWNCFFFLFAFLFHTHITFLILFSNFTFLRFPLPDPMSRHFSLSIIGFPFPLALTFFICLPLPSSIFSYFFSSIKHTVPFTHSSVFFPSSHSLFLPPL